MSTVILGGGLSGLSAAFYLLKKNPKHSINLLEASSRLGGWIKSNKCTNNILFEEGPRTIRPGGLAGANTLSLIEDIGLKDQIIPINSSAAAARNRMIYANGKLYTLPSSLLSIFRTLPPFSKPLIFYLLQDSFAPKKVINDESIYDFTSRRFGKEFADYLISPLICGICAGNSKEISVNFLMSTFFNYEQKYGNIQKGLIRNIFKSNPGSEYCELALRARKEKWSVYSFKEGLESLPKAIERSITRSNISITKRARCKNIEILPEKITLELQNGETIQCSQVISAISAEQLSSLLSKQHPYLSSLLQSIKSVTVAVVNLQFKTKVISNMAFGFLVPPKEKLPILGVIYDSCCFPKGDQSVLTVMMGGAWFEELFGTNPSQEHLLKVALDQLKASMGINEFPIDYKVNVLQKCIPQYIVGHNDNLKKINKYIEQHKLPLFLCGSSYYGVGVNDVILSSKNSVERLCQN